MASKGGQKKKDKNAKGSAAGRNRMTADQWSRYNSRVAKRTLARMLKSNGPAEAAEWAKKNEATHVLKELARHGNENESVGGSSKIAELAKQALSE